MQLGELGGWKSPSVVQGNRKAPVGGLGDQVPQKLKMYGERGGYRYRVTQVT